MKTTLETIGNATLIISENNIPILSTDPWFDSDPAYFGSWLLSHEFPKQQREKVENSKYIFISHFHPDHLNLGSLRHCKNSTILLAQHYGARVENDLRRIGFKVISLPSRKWIDIGQHTRIMIFNNELQDSALLIELKDDNSNKSLIINLNDTGGIGFEKEVASLSRKYKNSCYLQLHCWGDADMINMFDSIGNRILPAAAEKFPVGKDIQDGMKRYNCNIGIPFSCHHQYQRRDSYWANSYVTPVELMSENFTQRTDRILLPAFQELEFNNNTFIAKNINPKKIEVIDPIHESRYGDDWSQVLNTKQVNECKDYFSEIKTLFKNYSSIRLNVGGVEHEMLHSGNGKAKIKFSSPSTSLMKAIRNEIFDDLLIGNFMKTQIINAKSLYNPDFTITVCKYSDNGRVKAEDELKKYFSYYNHNRSLKDKYNSIIMKLRSQLLSMVNRELVINIKKLVRR